MAGCITQDYKDILVNMIAAEVDKAILGGFISVIPICEPSGPLAGAVEKAKRKAAMPWGIKPKYVDENGEEEEFSSPSALVGALGLPMSGTQCDESGNTCDAMSVVDILRFHGFIVKGNGEDPKKVSEGGHQFLVWHPEAPQIKEAEEKPRKKRAKKE